MVPSLCNRYYDDTPARVPSTVAAADFLTTLNGLHLSLKFTMELPADNMIPFIGIEIIKNGTELETCVYRRPTNTGLLLHFHSHEVKHYKTSLLKTMLHRAYALSSMTEAFIEECAKLCSIFCRLYYPIGLTNFTVNMFVQNIATKPEKKTNEGNMIRIVLPLRDQIAAIFVSKKLEQDLKPEEIKLSIVNQQCIGYKFA